MHSAIQIFRELFLALLLLQAQPIKPSMSFYWQLDGNVTNFNNAQIYDIDLFDSSPTLIKKLHEHNKTVICYFSAGTYENWRPDISLFPQTAIGEPLDDWPGERWLDIRDNRIKKIMRKRIDLALKKGCDGVEPDNIDGFTNDTGFSFSYSDQLRFNRFLAYEAHKRGLLIALKNDPLQAKMLAKLFDFAIVEECVENGECDKYLPFIEENKAVFAVEYEYAPFQEGCQKYNRFKFYFTSSSLDGSLWQECYGASRK
ncbi:endo alpha-1,4 polygalactosaminidase [Nitratiruptor sp. YY08-26]|uniref:endo alpha-1,4 polygalactosaminidase n=1 Tax=unclassified Nitratiruptor TaxID=2624044 RepID=UPI0019164B5A|nr:MULTISPECIES: endo alpha-1,4 polygalactosaminidase [unclassified Nitratiruptor]BCD63066.1 endo alpha-1,4 polygalactosaminidase [Nitratiruptor sp. YY08-13]BCD67001.1 endo alpha-1,4 polygalactosaminidase [Nitratiruptor sp. YY08-26]